MPGRIYSAILEEGKTALPIFGSAELGQDPANIYWTIIMKGNLVKTATTGH